MLHNPGTTSKCVRPLRLDEDRVNNNKEPLWTRDMMTISSGERSSTSIDKARKSETLLQKNAQDDPSNYDPYEFGNMDKPTSFRSTVIHLIIVSAGPPLLSIPASFLKVGYAVGLVGVFLSTYLYAHSMHTLLWSEYEICKLKRIPHLSYPDLIYFTFHDGPPSLRWFAGVGRYTVDIVFIVFWTSACCYNLTMAAENIHDVCNQWAYPHMDVHLIMICLVLPILLLCWLPKLKHLVPLSVIANVANMLCICVVIYDVLLNEESYEEALAFGSVTDLPFFLGSVFFALNATGLMLPLKKEMKEPGRFNSTFGILTATYFPVFFMYALFCPLCALKYGSAVKESVTQNVQLNSSLKECMILANALVLILQYPLFTYVIFDVVWSGLKKTNKKVTNFFAVEYMVRTGIAMMIFMITYLLPSVNLFLTFGGAVGTMIDSLLFPALTQTMVVWRVGDSKTAFYRCLCKNISISIVAVVLIVSGGASCIEDILRHYSYNSTAVNTSAS